MKTITEIALEKYPIMLTTLSASQEIDMNESYRRAFIKGFEEALSRIPNIRELITEFNKLPYLEGREREEINGIFQTYNQGANFVIDKLKDL